MPPDTYLNQNQNNEKRHEQYKQKIPIYSVEISDTKKPIQFQNKITQTREKCPCEIAQSQIPRTANKCQHLSDLETIMICKPFYQFISYEVIIPNELCKGDQIKMDSYFSWE